MNRKLAEFRWRHFSSGKKKMQNSVLWIKWGFFLRPDKLKVILPICLYFRTQADVITDAINLAQLLNSTSTYSIHIHRYIERYIHTCMDWLSEHWIEYVIKEEMNFVLSALPWISCHFFCLPHHLQKSCSVHCALFLDPGEEFVFCFFIVFVVHLPCLSSLPSDSSEQQAVSFQLH